VVVSPRLLISPSAILRRILRMILPLRVFGRPLTNWILSGLAMRIPYRYAYFLFDTFSMRTSFTASPMK
jgi:hypothetical protein